MAGVTPRPAFFVSLPGGASHAPTIAGAAAALDAIGDVLGWSGASAGAAMAALKAFGFTDDVALGLCFDLLRDNRVLDWELPDGDGGLCAWEVVPKLCDTIFGSKARLGDAVVPLVIAVSDLTNGRAVYLSKRDHPHVLLREALRASTAFPGVAPALSIPSLDANPRRRFTDGGEIDNTTDAVWDGQTHPRVSVRLGGNNDPIPIADGDYLALAGAHWRAMRVASNLLKSKRRDGFDVTVEEIGNGLDFSLTKTQIAVRYKTGHDDVMSRAPALLAKLGGGHE